MPALFLLNLGFLEQWISLKIEGQVLMFDWVMHAACSLYWSWIVSFKKVSYFGQTTKLIKVVLSEGAFSYLGNHYRKTFWHQKSFISYGKSRLRVVPHFFSGIVERAKRERTWKSPHVRKGDTGRGDKIWGTTDKALAFELMHCWTQNSDWIFHGNMSTSVKNAPAAINTWHNHNLQNK